MIKLLEVADFEKSTSPIDRNRKIISSYLNKKKFAVYTLSGRDKLNSINKLVKYKFDIIHTRAWPICIPLKILIKFRNPKNKHLFSVHGLPDNKASYKAGMWLANHADLVHCVSNFTKHQVTESYNVNPVVIYNGVNTKLFKPLKHYNDPIKILFIGSYVERKKPQYILKLAKKFPKCDFVMYGSHYDSTLFEVINENAKKIKNLTVNKIVSWKNLVRIYQLSDIFVFPSLHEGFANVLLEATSSGLPVVAFNLSSIPEIIIHGENGLLSNLLFDNGDKNDLKMLNFSKIDLDLRNMTNDLQYLIEDENIRKEMGKKARKISEKFDWHEIAKQYEGFYKAMIN